MTEKGICPIRTVFGILGGKWKHRILLELHYVERMSEKEIALVYHLPASTIRGRIHRAKKKLRKELDV